jgi:hypothetical protein
LLGRQLVVEGVVRAGLGNFPILTEFAVEVAPGCSDGKRAGGWQHVEKWLLFHRVNVHSAWISKNKGIILPISVFPDPAISALSVTGLAMSRAKLATHPVIGKRSKVG